MLASVAQAGLDAGSRLCQQQGSAEFRQQFGFEYSQTALTMGSRPGASPVSIDIRALTALAELAVRLRVCLRGALSLGFLGREMVGCSISTGSACGLGFGAGGRAPIGPPAISPASLARISPPPSSTSPMTTMIACRDKLQNAHAA